MYSDRQLFLAVAIALSAGFGLGVGVALAAVGKLDALRWVPLLLLGGCVSFDYQRDVANVKQFSKGSDKGEITVVWKTGTPEWVNVMCNDNKFPVVHGCSMLNEKDGRCLLFFAMPTGIMDVDRLAVMGHEFQHCMGMQHAKK